MMRQAALPYALGLARLLRGRSSAGHALRAEFAHNPKRVIWPLGFLAIGTILGVVSDWNPPIHDPSPLDLLELLQVFPMWLLLWIATAACWERRPASTRFSGLLIVALGDLALGPGNPAEAFR